MRLGPLGSTGLSVTPVGLGLAALGRPAYITLHRDEDLGSDRSVEAMRARAHEVLDAAYDAGVRYLDAARSYGRAEEFLTSWLQLRFLPPGSVTIGSKWGYTYTADWRMRTEVHEVKDHSLVTFERQWAETFALLGDRVALYQIHSATLESGVLEDAAVLSALAGLRERGVVAGLSVSGPRQAEVIRRALEVRVDGVNPFGSVQATWNVMEPSAGPALAEAQEAGWGVLVKEAVANGRLAPPDGPSALERVAERHDVPVDRVAIAAVLANPWADVALSGAVTAEQIASNVAAAELRLGEEDLAELAGLAEPAEAYWATRASLPWA